MNRKNVTGINTEGLSRLTLRGVNRTTTLIAHAPFCPTTIRGKQIKTCDFSSVLVCCLILKGSSHHIWHCFSCYKILMSYKKRQYVMHIQSDCLVVIAIMGLLKWWWLYFVTIIYFVHTLRDNCLTSIFRSSISENNVPNSLPSSQFWKKKNPPEINYVQQNVFSFTGKSKIHLLAINFVSMTNCTNFRIHKHTK